MYKAYLQKGCDKFSADATDDDLPLAHGFQIQSFLQYCRTHRWDDKSGKSKERTYVTTKCRNTAVGVKFEFELYDNFIGQFASTFFPHVSHMNFLEPIDRGSFRGIAWSGLEYTKHFVGVLCYLMRLQWLPDQRDDVGLPPLTGKDKTPRKLSIEAFPYHGFPERPPPPGKLVMEFANSRLGIRWKESPVMVPLFATATEACRYLLDNMHKDLTMRFAPARCDTFRWHIIAKWHLLLDLSKPTDDSTSVREWNHVATRSVKEPAWSSDQKTVLDVVDRRLDRTDPLFDAPSTKPIYLGGDPGTGKSEVLVHAAIRAANNGIRVLILCPTGTLVHAYRDRIPSHPLITIDTLHSALVIIREADEVVMYAPPSKLRHYDLFLVDEGSQIEDGVAQRLRLALSELPQNPVIVLAADHRQLRPIAGGSEILRWCLEMDAFYLTEVHRTNDQRLLDFLQLVRKEQPSRSFLRAFLQERHLHHDLFIAVSQGMELQKRRGHHFMWLCVTNKGAAKINDMALDYLKISAEKRKWGLPGDEKAGGGTMYIEKDIWIRLTQNLDKSRGFVNGALAQVVSILAKSDAGVTVFVARIANGALVLVHPIRQGQKVFLPCCYGYATTIRRSQGSSLHLGALFFDHCFPPERGYGYVGASRFRSSAGLYFYGRIRRTDWLPVALPKPDEETRRSTASISSESDGRSDRESDLSADERSDIESSVSSMKLGEDPDDFSSDDDRTRDAEDDNYLDNEGDILMRGDDDDGPGIYDNDELLCGGDDDELLDLNDGEGHDDDAMAGL